MFKICMGILSLFFIVPSALGTTSISLVDNATSSIKISNHALTRIFVKQDFIESVRGLEGSYVLTKDEKAGEIYVLPTKDKSFNLFISTREGHHFNLSFVSVNKASDIIELIPLSSGKSIIHFEKTNFYEQTLIALIRSMMISKVPEDYLALQSKSSSFSWPWNSMHINLEAVYQGKIFQGEIFQIENRSSKTFDLNEQQFFQSGTLALALEHFTLAPHQKTFLYRVIRRE